MEDAFLTQSGEDTVQLCRKACDEWTPSTPTSGCVTQCTEGPLKQLLGLTWSQLRFSATAQVALTKLCLCIPEPQFLVVIGYHLFQMCFQKNAGDHRAGKSCSVVQRSSALSRAVLLQRKKCEWVEKSSVCFIWPPILWGPLLCHQLGHYLLVTEEL